MRFVALFVLVFSATGHAAAAPATQPATRPATQPTTRVEVKIIPGKAIVPTDAMKRPHGELLSFDFSTRTGTFRHENTGEIMPFIIMPYSEIYRHAAFGDMQDFHVGEWLIFRLHQNEEGQWIYLTYFQDELSIWTSHHEYYYVDKLDPAKGTIEYTQKNMEVKPPFIRGKGFILETDELTRYWKKGAPATFADISVGDKIRATTHGVGSGNRHPATDIYIDDISMLKAQAEQRAIHTKRLTELGWPGYVDSIKGDEVSLTLFQEGRELVDTLKKGAAVQVAPCGVDRKGGMQTDGVITETHPVRNLHSVTIKLNNQPRDPLIVGNVARFWFVPATPEVKK